MGAILKAYLSPNYLLSVLTLPGHVLPAVMNMVNFKCYLFVDLFAICRRIKKQLCGIPYTAYQSDSKGGICRCLQIIFRVQSLLFLLWGCVL
jgi:hypothetical protein